ncbi:MAG: hypothetical protein HYV75_09090, partial [Opitutae bacterium]|nr:hypothetical protein [Opitutae bacterium]
TLNGSASVTDNLFVPGTPTVRLNGHPTYGGTLDGMGAPTPANHKVTLNGSAALGHVVRRTDAIALPMVGAPAAPTGSTTVNISAAGQTVDWTSVRNLTLSGGVGQYAVPAGRYGDFTANAGSGFTLGVAGASQPSVYDFQHLTLNGSGHVDVAWPDR